MKKIIFIILALMSLISRPCFAGVTANTIWEFQTGGDDTFGGGFDVTIANHGTDYSTTTSAHATLTTLSVVGASTSDIVVSPTDYTVAAGDVGNVIFVTGGSATAGFYQIVTATTGAGQKWTMDRSVGTAAQTTPGKMGGCRKLISSNSLAAALVAGNIVYIKNGSYAPAAWSSQTTGTGAAAIQILGYNSTRGDNPTGSSRPTLTMTSTNVFTSGGSTLVKNIIFSGAGTSVVTQGTNSTMENCKVTSTNATSSSVAVTAGNRSKIINSEIIAASCIGASSNNANVIYGSYIHGCTVGVRHSASSAALSISNTIISASTTAIQFAGSITDLYLYNSTLFGAETPAGTGIDGNTATAPSKCVFINNIIYGFTTGVNWNASDSTNWWDYNDFFNNTTARTNVTAGSHDLAVDPQFTSTSTGDFSIGTNLKGAGFPGAFPASTSTGYNDVGAVQRQESSGNNLLGVIQ